MNWYLVYGIEATDMCGSTQDVFLGIIKLPEHADAFLMPRPSKIGMHDIDNRHFLEIKFIKTKERTLKELQGFWIPPHIKNKSTTDSK